MSITLEQKDVTLKSVFRRNLHLSRIARQTSTVFAHCQRIDYPKIAIPVPIASGFVIVNRIGNILDLQAKFQRLTFTDVSDLANGHAQVLVSGKPEEVSADVAEIARSRRRELSNLLRSDVSQQLRRRVAMDREHLR